MIKKFICSLLVILMLGAVFAGCSQKSDEEIIEDETKKNSRTTATLSMYLMSEEKVSAEQTAKIEAAVNKITKSKFKIQLKLRYFTEDEYYAELENAMAKYRVEIEDRIKNNSSTSATTLPDGETTAEATYVNEFGIPELVYPTITDNQVDIFYFGGYDKFLEYRHAENLAKLDNDLTSTSKLLSSYIAPEFLTYVKSIAGGTYAIPNNRAVGEYTCLVMNKDILKQYAYLNEDETTKLETMFTSLTGDAVEKVLAQVKADHPDLIPLYNSADEIPVKGIQYFGMGANGGFSGAFSVLGGTYQNNWLYKTKNHYTPANNILKNTEFIEQLKKYTEYKEKGYVATELDDDEKFAIGYIKGNADLLDRYDPEVYATVVLEQPKITTEDIFEHLFGVFEKSASVTKSMEIITYLNTNEDFRNLIQYGIEGENYELADSDIKDANDKIYKVVNPLNGNYKLDPLKTGNNVILRPLINVDLANVREYDKIQLRSLKISLILGFDVMKLDTKEKIVVSVSEKSMAEVRKLSEEIYAQLISFGKVADLEDYIETAITTVDGNKFVTAMLNADYSPDTDVETYGEGSSFKAFYMAWLTEMGVYEKPKDEE